jgi:hypothetical protein
MQSRDASAEDGDKRRQRLRPFAPVWMALMQSVIRASGAGPVSIEAIRSAFMAAGKGVLRLTHVSPRRVVHAAFDEEGLFALFGDGERGIAVSQSA